MDYLFGIEHITEKSKQFISCKVELKTLELMQREHLNIVLTGRSGVGKKTLINSLLHLNEENSASVNQTCQYTSDVIPFLRLWNSKGIELQDYNEDNVFNHISDLVNDQLMNNNPDVTIHVIWYCVLMSRFDQSEKKQSKG